MNIYEKLVAARADFISMKIKMSGENKFAGYKYYELSDITPAINALERKYNFLCAVSFFSNGSATLTIVDVEKPEETIVFSSPLASASLKGCHEVQNLGAAQTYIKRYLYQHAFEIVEADVLNATHNPEKDIKKVDTPAPPAPKPFNPQDAINFFLEKGLFLNDIDTLIGRKAETITQEEAHDLAVKVKSGVVFKMLEQLRAAPSSNKSSQKSVEIY